MVARIVLDDGAVLTRADGRAGGPPPHLPRPVRKPPAPPVARLTLDDGEVIKGVIQAPRPEPRTAPDLPIFGNRPRPMLDRVLPAPAASSSQATNPRVNQYGVNPWDTVDFAGAAKYANNERAKVGDRSIHLTHEQARRLYDLPPPTLFERFVLDPLRQLGGMIEDNKDEDYFNAPTVAVGDKG